MQTSTRISYKKIFSTFVLALEDKTGKICDHSLRFEQGRETLVDKLDIRILLVTAQEIQLQIRQFLYQRDRP